MTRFRQNGKTSLYTFILLSLILIIGAGVWSFPSQADAQPNGPTPLPTYTFYPTYTPLPTYTPFPTSTSSPTPTATPTLALPPDLTFPTLEVLSTQQAVGSRYTHSSGSFSMDDLPSWDRHERGRLGDARVTFSNPWMSAFVEVAVNVWDGGDDTASVETWLTEEQLETLWGTYQSWQMIRYDDDGERILADFDLEFRGLPFVGRMILVPSGDFLLQMTIVAPTNARALLSFLTDMLLPSVDIHPGGLPTPDFRSYP